MSPEPRKRSLRVELWLTIVLLVLAVLALAVYAIYRLQFAGEFYLAIRGGLVLATFALTLPITSIIALVLAVKSSRRNRFIGAATGVPRLWINILHIVWAAALALTAWGVYTVGRTLALGAMGAVPTIAIAVLVLPFLGYVIFLAWWTIASIGRIWRAPARLPRGALLVGVPLVLVFASFGLLRLSGNPQWSPGVQHQVLFAPGDQPGRAYRIPAMTVAGNTVLAYAESRQEAMSDLLTINIVQRRSTDGGRTWGPLSTVAADGAHTVHSPTPVYDPATKTVWLPYCIDYTTLYIIKSQDAGLTWSKPRNLSVELGLGPSNWCHNGPGNGIVLMSGRLLVPTTQKDPRSLFSDDHGATWMLGSPMQQGGEEPAVFQRTDGVVCANLRSPRGTPRTVTCSSDGGQTWGQAKQDAQLISSGTQASIMRYSGMSDGQKSRVLFSSPGYPYRAGETLRLSYDDARTWPVSRMLWSGASGYSQLAVLPDHSILVAFECGNDDLRESITLARVDLAWLTHGSDTGS